ncbi:MAG: hypothetical protein ACP5XB_14950 [Isosphaeraceae bacterium]
MASARHKPHDGRRSPSFQALAALGALVLALGLVPRGVGDDAAAPASQRGKIIYQKRRSFRIPFSIDAQGRARLKEVQLWVSEDSGFHWEGKSTTTPELGKFTFRASHDGEYWFATRTITRDGQSSPPMNQEPEPKMKVVIDTVPPSIVLEPDGRRGSSASVRWEVKDEHLDLQTLALEYQAEGASQWRRVPIRRVGLIGAESWDAGTADSLRVRASVADKAGNVAETEIVLPEGTPGESDLAAGATEPPAPAVEQISRPNSGHAGNAGNEGNAGNSQFPPIQEAPPSNVSNAPNRSAPQHSLASRTRLDDRPYGRSPAPAQAPALAPAPAPNWDRGGAGAYGSGSGNVRPSNPPPTASGAGAANPFGNPFQTSDGAGGFVSSTAATNPGGGGNGGGGTVLVPNPRFKLQYAIEDAGPNGPASVELWITRDGGRTWIRRGEDPDRVSPFDVDLGGEGTYGLCLVARSASGLGDQPPAPGDPPQSWVEVDTTPPTVQLYPVQIGMGPHAGKVAITWRASDLHLAPNSVSLQWRPDQPGAAWQPIMDGQENMGQYIWTVPPSFPAKFHIRVEAVDSLGHHGSAETPETAPVIVDRSRPRSRIIGFDPNARAGDGPGARPLR